MEKIEKKIYIKNNQNKHKRKWEGKYYLKNENKYNYLKNNFNYFCNDHLNKICAKVLEL